MQEEQLVQIDWKQPLDATVATDAELESESDSNSDTKTHFATVSRTGKSSSGSEQFFTSWKNAQGAVEKGPLYVLWRLIEQNQVDVYHVSLFDITAEFILFIKRHNFVNLMTLADFISILSLLLKAKSQALLPEQFKSMGDDVIRLPQDIIDRLLEYRRYQKHIGFFRERMQLAAGVCIVHLVAAAQMEGRKVFDKEDLLVNFLRLSRKKENVNALEKFQIQWDEFPTIEEKMIDVMRVLKTGLSEASQPLHFGTFLPPEEKKENMIYSWITLFLALLELGKQRKIALRQKDFSHLIYVTLPR